MLDTEISKIENNIYKCSFTLDDSNVDFNGVLRKSELFRMFQESASSDFEGTDLGRSKMMVLKLAWVITDQYIEIQRMPVSGEKVTVETWTGRLSHVFFPRHYRLIGENGEKLVSGCSYWVLMDEIKRTLAFPSAYGIYTDGIITGDEIKMPRPLRHKETDRTVKFVVPSDYIDGNGHMNNAKYFDLADDIIPCREGENNLKSIQIQYLRELRLGDTADIGYLLSDGSCYIEGTLENQPFFRIKMTRL